LANILILLFLIWSTYLSPVAISYHKNQYSRSNEIKLRKFK